MSEGKKLRILGEVLGDYRKNGSETLFFCPVCDHHKRKLSVNIDKDVFKCWVCDWSGRSIYRAVRRYGTVSHRSAWKRLSNRIEVESFSEVLFGGTEPETKQVVKLPRSFKTLVHGPYSHYAHDARNYLYNRGIDDEDIVRWKIGYCATGQYAERIVVPSFNLDGDPNYFISRSYTGHPKKYMNPRAGRDIVFNELMVDFDDDLIIVEGVFDAIKAGINSVPLLGSTLREDSYFFQKIVKYDTPLFLGLDPDAKRKQGKMIRAMLEYGLEIYEMDVPAGKDIGDLTKKQVAKLKQEATYINPDNYLLMHSINGI